VVRSGDALGELEIEDRPGREPVLRHVATSDGPRRIDVYAGVAVGEASVVDRGSGDRYPVAVVGR